MISQSHKTRLHTTSSTNYLKTWKFTRNTLFSWGSYSNSGAKESGVEERSCITWDWTGKKPSKSFAVLKIFFTLKLWDFSPLFLSTSVMETEAWYFKMHKRGLVWLTLAAHLIQADGHTPEAVLHLQNCLRDAEVPLRLMLRNTRQCSQ